MKKLIAFILCFVMTVTALPVFALADNEAPMVITAIEAFSEDNMPLSMQEMETAVMRDGKFYLKNSLAEFDVRVRLSDGSEHSMGKSNPLEIDYYYAGELFYGYGGFESYEAYLKAVEEAHRKVKEEYDGKPVAYGSAYVKGEDYFEAKKEGLDIIRVYVNADVYEYDSSAQRYTRTLSRSFSFEKECVPYYVKLTPVSGLPDYFDRTTGVVDLSNTVFDIESYDGNKKQAKAVQTGIENMLPAYELDGRKLEYRIGIDSRTVFLTYYDWQYSWEVSNVKENPHEEIIIEDCIFEGNTLTEIVYTVENCYGQTRSYRKSVTDPSGEVLDTVDGYEIYVTQVEKSRFCSKVYLRAGQTKTERIWPHDFDNFFMNILAKIAVFFRRLIDR